MASCGFKLSSMFLGSHMAPWNSSSLRKQIVGILPDTLCFFQHSNKYCDGRKSFGVSLFETFSLFCSHPSHTNSCVRFYGFFFFVFFLHNAFTKIFILSHESPKGADSRSWSGRPRSSDMSGVGDGSKPPPFAVFVLKSAQKRTKSWPTDQRS